MVSTQCAPNTLLPKSSLRNSRANYPAGSGGPKAGNHVTAGALRAWWDREHRAQKSAASSFLRWRKPLRPTSYAHLRQCGRRGRGAGQSVGDPDGSPSAVIGSKRPAGSDPLTSPRHGGRKPAIYDLPDHPRHGRGQRAFAPLRRREAMPPIVCREQRSGDTIRRPA
jgi:hypothetical protein